MTDQPTSPALPEALQEFIDATNDGDAERFLDAFAPDATLDDWGRVFTGRDGIASWDGTDNIGVGAQFELVEHQADGEAHILRLSVSSNRFNGIGTLRFTLEATGAIATLVIS